MGGIDAYFQRLPLGIESYPDCRVKASVVRDAIASRPLDDVSGDLPPELESLVAEPPPVTAWVPEVHAVALMIAIRERHFGPGALGLEDLEQWTLERNRRLLTRPLYRPLFILLSPERLLKGLERRWSAFRRGTRLRVREAHGGGAELALQHPAHLYDEVTLRAMAGAFRAAGIAAGARHARAEIIDQNPREVRWNITWR